MQASFTKHYSSHFHLWYRFCIHPVNNTIVFYINIPLYSILSYQTIKKTGTHVRIATTI